MRVKEGNKEKDILEAAVKVFSRQGYHKAKISKIAEVAGVATGSVYVYFENKEDLLLIIFDRLWEKLYHEFKNLSERPNLTPLELIDSMIDLVFDTFTENPALADIFVNEQNHLQRSNKIKFTNYYEKFVDLGEEIITHGIQNRYINNGIDVRIFRYYILGALRNLLHSWSHDPKNFPLNKIRQNVKYLTRYGIQK